VHHIDILFFARHPRRSSIHRLPAVAALYELLNYGSTYNPSEDPARSMLPSICQGLSFYFSAIAQAVLFLACYFR